MRFNSWFSWLLWFTRQNSSLLLFPHTHTVQDRFSFRLAFPTNPNSSEDFLLIRTFNSWFYSFDYLSSLPKKEILLSSTNLYRPLVLIDSFRLSFIWSTWTRRSLVIYQMISPLLPQSISRKKRTSMITAAAAANPLNALVSVVQLHQNFVLLLIICSVFVWMIRSLIYISLYPPSVSSSMHFSSLIHLADWSVFTNTLIFVHDLHNHRYMSTKHLYIFILS